MWKSRSSIPHVAKAMGMDGRISPKFLHPGPRYGGSCFPKDTKSLAKIGQKFKSNLSLIEQTIKANENQKYNMVKKIEEAMGNLKEKVIGVLGITFNPNTCDMREAPSLVILDRLFRDGANIRIYDPQKVRNKGNGD